MAFNAEAEMKTLRGRIEALERQVDTLEKNARALPDIATMTRLAARLDAAEKAIAGKKDTKTADQEAEKAGKKLAAEIEALGKEQATKAMLELRLKTIEAQLATALAAANKR